MSLAVTFPSPNGMQVVPQSITGVIRPGCVLLGLDVRFRNWIEKQAALRALLAHSSWSETLLSGSPSAIDVKVQGSLFRVATHSCRGRNLCQSVCLSVCLSAIPTFPPSIHHRLRPLCITVQVTDGRLRSQTRSGEDEPCITSVEPIARLPSCETLTVGLPSLGNRSFKVLLRCGGHYHELDVLKTVPAGSCEPLTVVAR